MHNSLNQAERDQLESNMRKLLDFDDLVYIWYKLFDEYPKESICDVNKEKIIFELNRRLHQKKFSYDILLRFILDRNSNFETTSAAGHRVETSVFRGEELVVREKYYVLLLIDSSESMLWPYLNDQNSERDSRDWQDAIKKVQYAISAAHDMALTALRSSRICKDRSLYIYQYLFNNKMIILNLPEELSPFGSSSDKVFMLTENYYTPESTTALYGTISEALVTVEKDFLRKARDEELRIDKLMIVVITDGKDTLVKNEDEKAKIINEIKDILKKLRNNGYLVRNGSKFIGLTSQYFTKDTLKNVKNELSFDDAFSLDQSDNEAIRRAFEVFSSDAANY